MEQFPYRSADGSPCTLQNLQHRRRLSKGILPHQNGYFKLHHQNRCTSCTYGTCHIAPCQLGTCIYNPAFPILIFYRRNFRHYYPHQKGFSQQDGIYYLNRQAERNTNQAKRSNAYSEPKKRLYKDNRRRSAKGRQKHTYPCRQR